MRLEGTLVTIGTLPRTGAFGKPIPNVGIGTTPGAVPILSCQRSGWSGFGFGLVAGMRARSVNVSVDSGSAVKRSWGDMRVGRTPPPVSSSF